METPAPARWQVTSGTQDPGTVERLLRMLPGWFGIESSNVGYVESARELPTYLAWPSVPGGNEPGGGVPGRDEPVGVLLARRHFPAAAEIHLLAVDPRLHRQGAGRALVAALEADLVADSCALLQVKTLGPSHADAGYALTRKFYTALGFRPLEEMHDLWGPDKPCLIMVKTLSLW